MKRKRRKRLLTFLTILLCFSLFILFLFKSRGQTEKEGIKKKRGNDVGEEDLNSFERFFKTLPQEYIDKLKLLLSHDALLTAQNMVKNPSFESFSNLKWLILENWEGQSDYSISKSSQHSGRFSLWLKRPRSMKGRGVSQFLPFNNLSCPFFLYSFWINLSSLNITDYDSQDKLRLYTFLHIIYQDGSSSHSDYVPLLVEPSKLRVQKPWHHVVYLINLDPKPISSTMIFFIHNSTEIGEVFIDDVSLWIWPFQTLISQNFDISSISSSLISFEPQRKCIQKILNFHSPSNSIPKTSITLVTHFTLDRLTHFMMQMDSWDGPFSLSIYIQEKNAKDEIELVRALVSEPKINKYATIKIFMERGENCEYPINALRNLAISGVSTNYWLMLDVDLVPSFDTHALIQKEIDDFFQLNKKTISPAFVIPSFEFRASSVRPTTKEMVVSLLSEGILTPFLFHKKVSAQFPTNYKYWSYTNNTYKVSYQEDWEPYVITNARTIVYNELYLGYGGNKVVYTSALQKADVEFYVLSSPFVLHYPHAISSSKQKWLEDRKIQLALKHLSITTL